MPFCARCTGIYAGVLVGVMVQCLAGAVRPPPRLSTGPIALASLLLFGVAIEALGERSGWWTGSNALRLLLGMLAGTAMGLVLIPLCRHFLQGGPEGTPAALLPAAATLAAPAGILSACWMFPSLLSALTILSIAGLVALYLCLNLTLAGALVPAGVVNRNGLRPILLAGLAAALFAGEWLLFRYGKPQILTYK